MLSVLGIGKLSTREKISGIMASQHHYARLPQSILGFRRPSCRPSVSVLKLGTYIPFTTLNLRANIAVRLQVRQSLFAVFASNASRSDQDSPKEKSDGIKNDDAGQGPPLLTILAGFVVFFLVSWIIGSVVMWLISLIFNLPSSK